MARQKRDGVSKTLSPRKLFWINAFGWYGVAAYQIAYVLVSFHILSVDDVSYQVINLTGGLGLFVISLIKRAYQPAVSNLIWSLIALLALLNILFFGAKLGTSL
jgi:hypothetical protein